MQKHQSVNAFLLSYEAMECLVARVA